MILSEVGDDDAKFSKGSKVGEALEWEEEVELIDVVRRRNDTSLLRVTDLIGLLGAKHLEGDTRTRMKKLR